MKEADRDIEATLRTLAAAPVIRAPFIFASNDGEFVNAAKCGLVQLQAAILLESHPEIAFDTLANVVITDDVLTAVRGLELRVGHLLDAGRNGAAQMPVFTVDVEGKHFLFIAAEASKGLVGTGSIQMLTAFELVRVRLAEVHVLATLRRRIGADLRLETMDEARAGWFGRSRDAWICYACERLAYSERLSTSDTIDYLVRDIEVERRLIIASIDDFKVRPNAGRVANEIQKAAGFLTNSIAAALGQLHASGKDLEAWHPAVKVQLDREGLAGYWQALAHCFIALWETHSGWTGANDLNELSRTFLSFLSILGLTFEDDGTGLWVASFVEPDLRMLH